MVTWYNWYDAAINQNALRRQWRWHEVSGKKEALLENQAAKLVTSENNDQNTRLSEVLGEECLSPESYSK